MILSYEGTDITQLVTIEKCIWEARECGRLPQLLVEFSDNSGLWDAWGPKPGDRIEVSDTSAAKTGTLYVNRIEPFSGGYTIRADALPSPDVRAKRSWANTTFLTIVAQLAETLGLEGVAVHGVDDMALAGAIQNDEGALPVLARLCVFAGCTFDVYEKAIHICGRSWTEQQESVGPLNIADGAEYDYKRQEPFASCIITQLPATGRAAIVERCGTGMPAFSMVLSDDTAFGGSSDLRRACAGVLAYENTQRSGGYVKGSSLSPYSPGSVCDVVCSATPSLTGRGVITRIRNDYENKTSKTWWRQL